MGANEGGHFNRYRSRDKPAPSSARVKTAHRVCLTWAVRAAGSIKSELEMEERRGRNILFCLPTCSLVRLSEYVSCARGRQTLVWSFSSLLCFPHNYRRGVGKKKIYLANFSGFARVGAFLLWSCKATRRWRLKWFMSGKLLVHGHKSERVLVAPWFSAKLMGFRMHKTLVELKRSQRLLW